MLFKTAALVLGLSASASAQTFPPIAGYLPRTDATAYLEKDLIQKELEDIMGDEECNSFDLGNDFYTNGDGQYFQTIPTYTGSKSDTYKEYTNYYGKDNFMQIWVEKAFKKTKTNFKRGNANFFDAFGSSGVATTGSGACVGYEEVVKKGLSYTGTVAELLQLGQQARDAAAGGCIAQPFESNPTPCTEAIEYWDGAAAIYVGSLEGTDGGNTLAGSYGKAPYALADKRCRNFRNCGPDPANYPNTYPKDVTSFMNTKILALFAAGSHAAWAGDFALLDKYIQLISNKIAVPLIQGTFRYYYRLSDEEFGTGTFSVLDKEIGEGGAFIFGVLPKLFSCSTRGHKKVEAQTKIGGGVAGVSAVNFEDVKLGFECNYRCLGIRCDEIGTLFDGGFSPDPENIPKDPDEPKPGFTACDDEDNGSDTTCGKPKKSVKQKCKLFTGKPGVKNRDKLRF